MLDLAHLDEAGFALTMPTVYSWYPAGERLRVPYEAPQGRRVNVIGAYFTHGPEAGRLDYRSWAVLPKSRAKTPRLTPEERAAAQGLTAAEVGPIDGERLVAFLWQLAGRPVAAPPDWQRERPLVVALDNYSVHTGQTLTAAQPALAAANVELVYLARYCPEQSAIEPVWHDVKQHQIPIRSYAKVADLKQAVDEALARKAQQLLQQAHGKSTNIQRRAA
jgi:DDE superfamily endonuclease